MSRSSEENFQALITELAKNLQAYETNQIKYMAHANKVDSLFANYGWSRAEFFKEMNARLGVQTNETRTKPSKKKPKKSLTVIGVVLNKKEQELVRGGSMILAIKTYRERTGAGLKEAKDTCEQWRDANCTPRLNDEIDF